MRRIVAEFAPSTAVACVLLFAGSCPAASQQTTTPVAAVAAKYSHEHSPIAHAAPRSGVIRIDGHLDEAAWQAATPITGFRQRDPHEGEPASEPTEARVLIDGDAIYIGMRLHDSDPRGIQSQLARRDENIEGDIVEVVLDTYHDHRSAFLFRLSAAGARRDASVIGDNEDNSWDAVWEGSSSIDAEGWTAEFRIPLSQLRYNPNELDHTWGLQLTRTIARKAEEDFFALTPKTEESGVHRYGHLAGLGKLPSPRRLELVPYALTKNQNPVVAAGDPFRRKNDLVTGAGLDLKYGITSNLTLDATFNPDFGQVEVDPAVVNLSAFETFFPERRPFFVEGASIFSFGEMRTENSSNGYNFLHSRRIGREPSRGIGGATVDWVDAPLETTIDGAVKLSGRSSSGWSLGVLDALTARESARYRDDTGDHTATVEPRSNYFIGRVKRDLRQGNTTVGMAMTAVNRDLSDPALVPMFRSSAYTLGVDWQHAWANRRWAFDGAVAGTTNRGSAASIEQLQLSPARYFQRPDRKTVRYDPTKTSLDGYVAEATFAKLAGKHWKGTLTFQDYSPGFEINEVGFLGGTDFRGVAPLISYTENTPNKYLRNWAQYLFWNPSWNYDGDMTFNGVGSITVAELPNYWNYFLRLDWRPPVFDDVFTRGGPVARVVTSRGIQVQVDSDRRKRYTIGATALYFKNEAGGWNETFAPRATLRPSTALRITLQPSYSRVHSMAQYVTARQDPTATATYGSRYVFATLEQNQVSMVTRVDWTFTPQLSLQLFAQPLIASADFHDYKEFERPRTYDFHTYDASEIAQSGSVYTVDPDGAGPAASFTFNDRDFNRRSLRGNAVLRWEYRPGSALFFVWQQSRFASQTNGEFDFRQNFNDLWSVQPENVFVLKATYWLSR
jgi:hypothetical protein